jgi:hypothetical protein
MDKLRDWITGIEDDGEFLACFSDKRYGSECSAIPTKRLIKVGTGREEK